MDCGTKLGLVVFFFLSATYMQQHCVVGVPQVPCLFIFGDSLSDSGNNNNLRTEAKVNYLPYGIDFPGGPTGRFTNGKTAVDILTELLGFDGYIPPFANTSASDILKGVNYASGAAGILKETGTHLGEDISLGAQLQNHKVIVTQITQKLGTLLLAQQHLNKCLYYVNIGNNDFINNYFLPEHYTSSRDYTVDQYTQELVQEYSMHLKELHALGARKFALIGVSLIGCTPHEIITHGREGAICVDEENNAAILLNDKLRPVVDQFNKELPEAKFIFINSALMLHGVKTPRISGINNITNVLICCKAGSNGQCIPNEKPCDNRHITPFFDEFHTTEMANQVIARSCYHAPLIPPNFAHPMDISHLVKL
ncbi:hypothetical protein VNO78_10930 [Psophocarpus tetragonolobus]|uniref:Uncharacterized protein n=1 Tax=Psophocarpus tetragonolobus TaxID=3891 RepID=A0AAN9SNA7_PSOTE